MSIEKLSDLEKKIERRKAEKGLVGEGCVLPNSGQTRTPEKSALLRMIATAAEERGLSPPFKANY